MISVLCSFLRRVSGVFDRLPIRLAGVSAPNTGLVSGDGHAGRLRFRRSRAARGCVEGQALEGKCRGWFLTSGRNA